jgi:two-component sensor histidine kinase
VANSLQLVSSLVHLQRTAAAGGPAADALRDTQARIDAIMQVYRRLYTSEDVRSVDMQEYLGSLTAELAQSLAPDGPLTFHVDAAAVKLPTDMVVSIGVIVAELVTNACKYAYPDGQSGEVRIGFRQGDDGGCRLVVEDDGRGFSPSDPVHGTGLGRTVISAMARNLNGVLSFDPDHAGARAVLAFMP